MLLIKMAKEIICDICKKEIKSDDEIILGSKDDYTTLPADITSGNIIFLHSKCLEGYLNDR